MTPTPIPRRVVVVQTSLLGDLVLATPVFGALRRRWPAAHIAALVRPEVAPILRDHPDLDAVLVDDKRGRHSGARGLLRLVRELRHERFDVALSLHRATRTALILTLAEIPLRVGFRQSEMALLYHRRVWRDPSRHDTERQLSLLEALGIHPNGSPLPRLGVGDEARGAAEGLLATAGVPPGRPYVVVAPGSSWRSKQWMPERFAEVVRALLEEGTPVVLVGSRHESTTIEEIQRLAPSCISLAGKTDVAGLAAVIGGAEAVVCNDSGAMHVTQAFGVPLVAVVGPTSDAQGFMPRAPRSLVVRDASLTCRPRCRFGSLDCPLAAQLCLTNVTSEQVLSALAAVRADPTAAAVAAVGPCG